SRAFGSFGRGTDPVLMAHDVKLLDLQSQQSDCKGDGVGDRRKLARTWRARSSITTPQRPVGTPPEGLRASGEQHLQQLALRSGLAGEVAMANAESRWARDP